MLITTTNSYILLTGQMTVPIMGEANTVINTRSSTVQSVKLKVASRYFHNIRIMKTRPKISTRSRFVLGHKN